MQQLSPELKLINWLSAENLDGVFIKKRQNFSWVTEGKVNHIVNTSEYGVCDLILMKEKDNIVKKYCITSKMEAKRIMEEELEGLGYVLIEFELYENPAPFIERLIDGKNIIADSNDFGLKDYSTELSVLRSRLSHKEVNRHR